MTPEELHQQIKDIKAQFRLFMNGVTAASMRKKGLEYKINWGVSQMDLRCMAEQYKGDKALAEALWEEKNIRECRLLATLIMPADEMDVEQALKWAEDASTIELMESAVFNLFQHMQLRLQTKCWHRQTRMCALEPIIWLAE